MKTFKSAVSLGQLNISEAKRGLITVSISRNTAILEMIDLSTETAPALALAILEAAGTPMNLDVSLGKALYHLDAHVTLQAKATAEAKEQAELEAEALELFNAQRKHQHYPLVEYWDMQPSCKDTWLAVARRAREMAKEAPSA